MTSTHDTTPDAGRSPTQRPPAPTVLPAALHALAVARTARHHQLV